MTPRKRQLMMAIALVGALVLIGWISLWRAADLLGDSVRAFCARPNPLAPTAYVRASTVVYPPVNKEEYAHRLSKLAKNPTLRIQVYPNPGGLLPFHRIVAYYGNLFSKQMGILGQYPEAEMLERLRKAVARWGKADPQTPVVPALHYIAVAAQGAPGRDGKYRVRMSDEEIRKILLMARKVKGIVFLDVQVGLSNAQTEVPRLDRFLRLAKVHLGLDPEFYMRKSAKPGQHIGSMDAADIKWAIRHLSAIVDHYHLPPKILVIHRFTGPMITHASKIIPTPEVQVVIDMDGWGSQQHKRNTYRQVIIPEPVQFAGFKLFYHNDTRESGSQLMTPEEVLSLVPQPVYIQYQ